MRDVPESYSEEDFERRKTDSQQSPVTESQTGLTGPAIPVYRNDRERRERRTKRIVIGVIVAIVLWAVYFSVSITGKGNFSQRATVFTMNLFLPYKLSKAMSMDKVEIISPTEMQFNFTMLAMDRSAVSDTSALIALWKPMLVKSMHKNSGNEYYRKNHVKLICCIADKYGKYMFRIPITPADYDTYR